MKFVGVAAGAVLSTALRLIWKFLKLFVKIFSEIIFRLGLYVPIAYLIYGAAISGIFDFNLFSLSTDSKLYIVGFAVSIICSITITIRMIWFSPKSKRMRNSVIEYSESAKKLPRNMPEPPKIYNSRVNPGIIVYEYANRYDIYRKVEDGLILIDTEFKKPKGIFASKGK